ncbi:MAG: hypothetical protein P9L92_09760 [Candidatus Electryonea clarkiae]|nr:hypothetical protein [Candidatus Electryonea clarkiae]MDP8286384.1 hypothetical protein [Candidatus Electryonea clarkiae]
MVHISDRKYAEEMGLDLVQVRKMIKRLDIAFFSSGKGESMVYMFDPEEMNAKMIEASRTKKDRKRGPRKKKSSTAAKTGGKKS